MPFIDVEAFESLPYGVNIPRFLRFDGTTAFLQMPPFTPYRAGVDVNSPSFEVLLRARHI